MRRLFTSALLGLLVTLGGCTPMLTRQTEQEAIEPALPPAAVSRFSVAEALLRAGRYPDAEADFKAIAERWPEHGSAWINLGYIYRRTGRLDDAIAAFERALDIDPADCLAWLHLGAVHRARYAFDDAEASYRGCLGHQPEHAAAWLNLGILYELNLGRLADALAAYERYQAVAPGPDDRVALWMADLARRIERSQTFAGGDR